MQRSYLYTGDIFGDPIDRFLKMSDIGEVDGVGTLLSDAGEIEHCDVEIYLDRRSNEDIGGLLDFLIGIGVPKGTFLISDDSKEEIGDPDGLALYLNGTESDEKMYASSDADHLIFELTEALGSEHRYFSYREGPEETALHF
jgi:hypothetical protein